MDRSRCTCDCYGCTANGLPHCVQRPTLRDYLDDLVEALRSLTR
jgi:hypothetical protein